MHNWKFLHANIFFFYCKEFDSLDNSRLKLLLGTNKILSMDMSFLVTFVIYELVKICFL